MSDDPKKKKKKGKKGKDPQKILEDALKAASSLPDGAPLVGDQGVPAAASVAGGDGPPPPSSQPQAFVFSESPTSQADKSSAAATNPNYSEISEVGVEKTATGAVHTYNEVTFHQPGKGVARPGDGAATGAGVDAGEEEYEITTYRPGAGKGSSGARQNVRRSLSATYEHPSPVHPAPVPSLEYMTLGTHTDEKSVYDNPDVGNSKARRMLGGVTRRLTALGRSESGTGLGGSTLPKSRAVSWNLLLVVASLVVASLAILLSVVAIGLTTAKCSSCKEDPNPVQARPGIINATLNCTNNLGPSCTFTSGPYSDPQTFCETTPTPFGGTAPNARSLGCVIQTSLDGPEDTFVATFLKRPEGYSCQCYQTGNGTVRVDITCSVAIMTCSLV